jgi:hypothetical protein
MALLVVVTAEGLLRLPVVEAVWGKPDLHYRFDVQVRQEALEAFLDDHEQLDVLFVGSSVVRANINPLAFDDYLATQGISVASFNGGLTALWPDQARIYLERFWLKRAEPLVIVQSIRYEELVTPRPISDFAGWENGRYEPIWDSSSPVAPIQEFLLDNSRLAQYSGRLARYFSEPRTRSRPTLRPPIDERGFSGASHYLPEVLMSVDRLEVPGGRAATDGFSNPIEPSTFEPGLGVLAETVAVARAAGAEYVLVNMPEHGDKFLSHPDGEARYRFFVEALAAFAEEQGVAFVDLTGGDALLFATDEPFSDFHHFNQQGALDFTLQLAKAFDEMGLLPGTSNG